MSIVSKKSISWIGLSQVVSVGLQFAGSVVLAHYLSPRDMGIYAVAAATVGVLGLIQAFGLQSLIVREEVLTDELCRTAFTINALTSILLAVSTAGLSIFGGAALGDDRVRYVMLALAISPLFGIFDFLPGAQLERAGRFKALALASIVSGIACALVTIAAAVLGANYMTAAYGGWASAGVYGAIVNVIGRDHIRLRPGLKHWRRTLAFGVQMLATSGLHALGGRFSDIALAKFQGLASLGLYSRAGSLNALLWNNVHLAAGRVMLVDFSQLHREGTPLRERYIATVDVITALLWPAFAGLAVLAGPLIVTIYGMKWAPAAWPLSLLSISSIVLVAITMTWEIFTATGNIRTQTRIEFYNAIFSLLAFAAGSYVGLAAAAASRIVSSVLTVMIFRSHLNRMTGTTSADFIAIYARSAVLTLLAIAPSTALMLHYGFAPDAPLPPVLASVAAGVLLWLGGLFLCGHRLLGESRHLLSRFRRSEEESAITWARPYETVESHQEG